MAYNYHNAVVASLEEAIRDDLDRILEHFDEENLGDINREDLKEFIESDSSLVESATGNGSGSYFCNAYKSAEALTENDKVIAEALDYFEENLSERAMPKETAEYLDVLVRDYEMNRSVDEVIDNIIESPDKQVAESEPLEDTGYDSESYKYEVYKTLNEYLTANIADILEENEINTTLDYENFEPKIEADVLDLVAQGEVDLPSPSSREIMHNLEKAFNEDYIGYSPYTVQDYCTNADIENIVKDRYAENVAFKQISTVFEEAYDSVVLPAIEQREAEQDFDRD